MEKSKNVEFVNISVDEIGELKMFEYQRLASKDLTPERITELGFGEEDIKRLNSRVKKYKKSFLEQGKWLDCAPMTIYEINTNKYVVDGAGRLCALNELIAEFKKNGAVCPISEIPAVIYYGKTDEDLANDTRVVNICNVNWTPNEILRSKAMREGGQSKENYILMQEIRTELGLPLSSYIPRLIMYGYDGSRKEKLNVVSDKKQVDCEAFRTFFRVFYNIIDKKYTDADGNMNRACMKMYRRAYVGQALYSVATNVFEEAHRQCVEPGIKAIKLGEKLANAFISYCYGEKQSKKNNFNTLFVYANGSDDCKSRVFKAQIADFFDDGYVITDDKVILKGIENMVTNMSKGRMKKHGRIAV